MKNNTKEHCPKCGATLPAQAPQGLCPKCLLQQVTMPTEGGPEAKNPPPTREELAHAFPNLEILELIGRGGMGFVYKARQPKLDRIVALKILPQSLASDPAFTERFTREGRVLARLNHPNIVTVHDFGQANGFFYLLMEFVEGVNLRQAMRAGRFSPAEALSLVPNICEALQYAHNEGILHRDIKPENILLDTRGRVKIADFGIAKLVGEVRGEGFVTESGATLGTPHYMAPEQIERPAEVDHRADIYSLGVVIYELLTGELPLGRFPPPSQKTPVSAGVDAVVLRALEKERERRYQSAGEVKTEVEGLAEREEATCKIPTAVPSAPKHFKRLGILFLVLGTLCTLGPLLTSWRTNMMTFNVLGLMLFTGVALLTRDRIWRDVALVCSAVVLLIMLGMVGSYEIDLLSRRYSKPPDPSGLSWSQRSVSFLPLIPLAASAFLLWGNRTHFHGPTWRERPLFGLFAAVCPILLVAVPWLLWRATSTPMVVPPLAAKSIVREEPPLRVGNTRRDARVIELVDVTNQMHGVGMRTQTPLEPNETLIPWLRYPDGRMEEAISTCMRQRRGEYKAVMTSIIYVLPESFSNEEIDKACGRVLATKANGRLALLSNEQHKLFSAVDQHGRTVEAYLERRKTEVTTIPRDARASLRFKTIQQVGHGFYVIYAPSIPPGYGILATDNDPNSIQTTAHASVSRSAHGVTHQFLWMLPLAWSEDSIRSAIEQVRSLQTRGAVQLAVEEPEEIFSVTNGTEVYRGYLELIPPTDVPHAVQ